MSTEIYKSKNIQLGRSRIGRWKLIRICATLLSLYPLLRSIKLNKYTCILCLEYHSDSKTGILVKLQEGTWLQQSEHDLVKGKKFDSRCEKLLVFTGMILLRVVATCHILDVLASLIR